MLGKCFMSDGMHGTYVGQIKKIAKVEIYYDYPDDFATAKIDDPGKAGFDFLIIEAGDYGQVLFQHIMYITNYRQRIGHAVLQWAPRWNIG